MKKISSILLLVFMTVCLCTINSTTQAAAAKKTDKKSVKPVKASVSKKRLDAGKTLKIHAKTSRVKYSSSNSNIAYVNEEGVITGKRAGEVTITVKRAGYQSKKIPLTIRAVQGKPTLAVACDEVKLRSVKMKKIDGNRYQYSAIIHNTAKKGTIQRISYYYKIETQDSEAEDRKSSEKNDTGESSESNNAESSAVSSAEPSATSSAQPSTGNMDELSMKDYLSIVSEEENDGADTNSKGKIVVLTAKNIKAGKKSSRVSCEGDISGKISAMHLSKIVMYTEEARYVYDAKRGTGSAKWYGKDQTGPVITGWVRGKSVYQGEPLLVCYTDRKGSYNFKEHVQAVDARDGKVPVSVDTSHINWDKEGIYKVYYTAKDDSGNQSKTWAKVQVYKPGTAEQIADIILRTKIKSGSDVQKLRKIYQYVPTSCSYVGFGSHTNWRATAVRGIRSHKGDCFTYYSIAKLLIVRSGIPHIMMRRYPERPGNNHWWNLVYVKGGWYHLDTTPRLRKGYFCLQTDEQLWMYSTGSTFRFNKALYPARAKKRISRNPI